MVRPAAAADLLLSRIDLPTRRFAVLSVPAVPPWPREATEDFDRAETDGVLLLIEPPIREVLPDELPTAEVLPELAAGCLAPVGVEGLLAPIELPMRPCDRRNELVPVERETLPELERLLELAAGCFAAVETNGLSIRIEPPACDLELVVGLSILIDRLRDEDTDGVLVLMEPPIRELRLKLVDGRLEIELDGGLAIIVLPRRDLLPGLMRLMELLLMEVEPVELLLIEVLDDGLRELEGLEIVIRLDVDPLGLLLDDTVPERLGVDLLTDILLELLRLGTDLLGLRLEVIVLDRLGVGALLTGDLLALLRLEIVVLDRLCVGALLADDRLKLLRLDVVGRDRLCVGALLTDDLLALLRLDVMDLVGGLTDRELLLLDELADALALGTGAGLAACCVF
ncbi:MAG: hypothetical protein U9Q07_02935 [Planctomycetota bacterium]|nr:hypothetical protein [Planctomycetota bacterium]